MMKPVKLSANNPNVGPQLVPYIDAITALGYEIKAFETDDGFVVIATTVDDFFVDTQPKGSVLTALKHLARDLDVLPSAHDLYKAAGSAHIWQEAGGKPPFAVPRPIATVIVGALREIENQRQLTLDEEVLLFWCFGQHPWPDNKRAEAQQRLLGHLDAWGQSIQETYMPPAERQKLFPPVTIETLQEAEMAYRQGYAGGNWPEDPARKLLKAKTAEALRIFQRRYGKNPSQGQWEEMEYLMAECESTPAEAARRAWGEE
jgi:hypothetical protein